MCKLNGQFLCMSHFKPQLRFLFVVSTLHLSLLLKAEQDVTKPLAFPIDTIIAFTQVPQSHIYFYCDSTNQMKLEDVMQITDFQTVPTGFKRIAGLTYWIRFSLSNETALHQDLVVFLGKSENIELHEYDALKRKFIVRKNGRRIPYPEKDIQGFINYGNYISLNLPADTTSIYYARTHFERYFYVTPEVSVVIFDKEAHFTNQYFYNLFAAIFIGALLVMSLYTSLLALTIKDRVYYYYVGFIIFALLFYTYYYGFTIEWLWPNSPIWDIYCFVFIISGTFFFWIIFGSGFLDTKENLPGWNKFLMIIAWINLTPCLLVFLDIAGLTSPYFLKQLSDVQNILGMLTVLTISSVSWTAYRKDIRSAKFFLAANIALLAGTFLLLLRFFGIIPANIFINNAGQFGFFLQLILFSLGLGDRINRMKEELIKKDLKHVKLEQQKEQEKLRLIEEKNTELEEKVKERTIDVERQKAELVQKAKLLEVGNLELQQVNQFKDRLFSIIGHDLRNPLGALRGILELQKSGALTREEMIEISKELDISLHGVMSTLDNLLIWALQQMDKIAHNPTKCNVQQLVYENINLMAAKSAEKQIQVVNEIRPETTVIADVEMLRLVIRNLLSNALKFTQKGGQIIFYSEQSSGHQKIHVKDTGAGIDHTDMNKLFGNELFSTRGTENERGTGLGLKLCHDFIEKNNGMLSVTSKPGEGSVFTITLPTD